MINVVTLCICSPVKEYLLILLQLSCPRVLDLPVSLSKFIFHDLKNHVTTRDFILVTTYALSLMLTEDEIRNMTG